MVGVPDALVAGFFLAHWVGLLLVLRELPLLGFQLQVVLEVLSQECWHYCLHLSQLCTADDERAKRIGYVRFRDAFCRYRSGTTPTSRSGAENPSACREKKMTTVVCHCEKETKRKYSKLERSEEKRKGWVGRDCVRVRAAQLHWDAI